MADNVNRLLIVADEPSLVDEIEAAAAEVGYAVAAAVRTTQCLSLFDTFQPTVILLDLELLCTEAVELLPLLAARACEASVVLMADVDDPVLSTARGLGESRGLVMAGVLAKPVGQRELRSLLTRLSQHEDELGFADLERALSNDELVTHYQPKASRREGGGWRIDAVEALVRWRHPVRGLLMPDELVPLAERFGAVGELTDIVLRQALEQLERRDAAGLDVDCAVNLAPSAVTDLDFPERVAAMLEERGLEAGRLRFELTETATLQDPMRAMDVLTRLKAAGIGLSLDDFGAGFSSLTRLYQMPFDEMKIDNSLVIAIPRSRQANTLVGSLIELGHNLGLEICGEGVETRAALDLLEALGCDRVQGFFISRALPSTDIPSFVTRWNRDNPPSSDKELARRQA